MGNWRKGSRNRIRRNHLFSVSDRVVFCLRCPTTYLYTAQEEEFDYDNLAKAENERASGQGNPAIVRLDGDVHVDQETNGHQV